MVLQKASDMSEIHLDELALEPTKTVVVTVQGTIDSLRMPRQTARTANRRRRIFEDQVATHGFEIAADFERRLESPGMHPNRSGSRCLNLVRNTSLSRLYVPLRSCRTRATHSVMEVSPTSCHHPNCPVTGQWRFG
jgi:hypothetical protein